MEITYNQYQLSVLTERVHFLKQIKTALLVSTIIFAIFLALGVFTIWMGFALMGVITVIIAIIPVSVAFGLLNTASYITRMLKKHTYKVFRVKCATAQQISGSPLWRKVKTQEGIEIYFYAGDPERSPKNGEEIDVLIHSKKKVLKFGYFAITES